MENQLTRRPGYIKTKLGRLPVEWKVERLDSLFSFKNGVNAGKEDYGKGVKFINVSEIFNNNSIRADIIPGSVAVSEDVVEKYAVKRGDVLFNRTSETQEEIAFAAVYLDDEKVVFGGFVIRARSVNDKMNDQFKKYCFQSSLFRKQVMAKGQGAVRANIGQNDLGTVKIPLPPLPEQQKIATILSTWDRAIALTRQLVQEKEAQKKGLMQRLLTGQVRVKGFEGVWENCHLDKLTSRVSNGMVYDTKNTKGERVTRIETISNGEINFGKTGFISKEEENPKYLMTEGDILYSHINSLAHIGKVAYYNGQKRLYHGMNLSLIRCNSLAIPKFVYYWLKSSLGKKWAWKFAKKAVSQASISTSEIKNIVIKVPNKQEQTAIATILTQADEEIRLLREKEQALQAQKKGLMQRLLTGKVRVNP